MRHAISLLAAAALLLCLPSCRFVRVSDELRQQAPEERRIILHAEDDADIPEADIPDSDSGSDGQ